MATDLGLDDALIEEAKELGHHQSKAEAVTAALQEYIRLQRRQRVLELEGNVDFDPAWDPKEFRRRDAERGQRWQGS